MTETDPLSGDFNETAVAKISQGGAGNTSVVTGVTGKKIYVTFISLTLDAAGTIKFLETAGDLTGTLNLAQNGGIVAGSGLRPILWTSTAGEDLQITTATGKAQGWLTYFTA